MTAHEYDSLCAFAALLVLVGWAILRRVARTRARPPAESPYMLGLALASQAGAVAGAEARQLRDQAVTAFRAALQARPRDAFPQDWAQAQHMLGVTLAEQAGQSAGAEPARLLAEAAAAHRAALQVYTRAAFPEDWAHAQLMLGLSLVEPAGHSAGLVAAGLLTEAITALRNALEVFTAMQFPDQHAEATQNLAAAEASLRKLNPLRRQSLHLPPRQAQPLPIWPPGRSC